jgi:AraC-like DNA-binding protein
MLPCKIPVGLVAALSDAGVSHHQVLFNAQLAPTLLDQPGPRVSVADYYALWQAIGTVSRDPNIGIKLAQSVRAELTEPLFLAVLSAADIASALGVVCAYKRQLSPDNVTLVRDDAAREVRFVWRCPPTPALPQVLVDAELAFIVEVCRRCTGAGDFRPRALHLCATALDPRAEHAAFFGCPLYLGADDNVIVFAAPDLERPFVTSNPQMLKALLPYLDVSTPPVATSSVARVRLVIAERLRGQRPTARTVARELAMSTRAMQRLLQDEGTSFRQVLDEVRNDHARNYLTSTSFSDHEVSFLLGFADPNSFYRAFRSWNGMSPSDFRGRSNV